MPSMQPRRALWSLYFGLMVAVPGSVGALAAEDEGIRADVVYGHKDGMALTYDVFRPVKPRGTGLLFMVSGGWVSSWVEPKALLPLVQPMLDQGHTVFAVRHGSSPRYVIPEIVSDVRLALKHIHSHADSYQVDPQRLGVFGFSAGGHLSLVLGTTTNDQPGPGQPHVAAVAAVFPPTDLAPYVDPKNPLREKFPALKFPPENADLYSPLKNVTSDDAPSLMVHGDKDELVPIWHSQKIEQAFAAVGVPSKLVTIEGAGHGFDADAAALMVKEMVAWFDTCLAAEKPTK